MFFHPDVWTVLLVLLLTHTGSILLSGSVPAVPELTGNYFASVDKWKFNGFISYISLCVLDFVTIQKRTRFKKKFQSFTIPEPQQICSGKCYIIVVFGDDLLH